MFTLPASAAWLAAEPNSSNGNARNAESPTHLLGFVAVTGHCHWVDRFNPMPARRLSFALE